MTLQKERLSQLRKERELEEFENENKVTEGGRKGRGEMILLLYVCRVTMYVSIHPLIQSKLGCT